MGYAIAGLTAREGGMGTQVQNHQGQGRLPNGSLKLIFIFTQRQTDMERDAGKL